MIVLGNDKGGTGKSTLAIHLAIAVLDAGYRVATIDMDTRQRTLTHFIESRRQFASDPSGELPCPQHAAASPDNALQDGLSQGDAYRWLVATLADIEETADVVIIDTSGNDARSGRIAHGLADTLVTPTGDSFIDLDALGRVDVPGLSRIAGSSYARQVYEAHRQRRQSMG